ncbi:MAG: hypothetical protein U1E51_16190, partial [Candidatus Binatia bacterium]|nr:hypothetical protein [Candidatus Binatia bacterium]
TKKAKKVTPKKVQKVEASRKRADGPVAQARVIFEKMRNETDSSKIIAACVAAKINKGTAGVQLGRWRKENGIVVKRGGARAKPVEKKAVPKPKAAVKDKKKEPAKKPVTKSKPAAKKPAAKPAVAPVAAGTVVDSQQPGAEAGEDQTPAAAS